MLSLVPGCALLATPTPPPSCYLGATRLPGGLYAVVGIDHTGQRLWQTPLPERCHGGCLRPHSSEVVIIERRPGWRFHVLDAASGHPRQTVRASEGEHFYGHGAFSPDGRLLYTTASHYPSGEGLLVVYDAERNYQRVDTLALHGIGPHELRLHPDGETLVIGLGGIRTHPDYDRVKLNLDSMAPALMLVNRHTGQVPGRFHPSHHQLSCRHLDIAADGTVYAGYQYQGAGHHLPPLLCRYRDQQFDELRLPEAIQRQLHNYIASVAAHPDSPAVAVTAPRGGVAVVFHGRSGEVMNQARIPDCAGVRPVAAGGFLVTAGDGSLHHLPEQPVGSSPLSELPLHWDNHLFSA